MFSLILVISPGAFNLANATLAASKEARPYTLAISFSLLEQMISRYAILATEACLK